VLAASLLGWVLLEVRSGGLDDLEAPALRAALDDDSTPERPGERGPTDAPVA